MADDTGGFMIRILHMTPPDVNNGVYRYIFSHMKYMDKRRFQFAFLTKGAKELRETPEYREYGFEVYKLEGVQRDGADAFRREIVQILENGFDILHLHTSSWRGFMIEEIAMELRIPGVIVHSHSAGVDEGTPREREERIRVHESFKRQFSMRYATDVWACSRLAADWLYGEAVPRDRIRIMPNAIDPEKYRYQPEKRDRMREQLGISDKFVVGNIGRYAYQKNHEFLIRVFARVCKENSRMHLLCLGEGELLTQLKELTHTLGIAGQVSLLGWKEKVEDYLQAMDVFCLPSRFEGLPISIIEAQTAGLRCLVADTVTEEVKLTELVTFLPIEEMRWVQEILDCDKSYQRAGWDEKIICAGYDIRSAAKKLEEMYEGAGEQMRTS